MAVGKAVGLRVPGIAASASIRPQSESTFTPTGGKHHDRSACTAAATRIIGSAVIGARAVSGESCTPSKAIRTNENNAVPGGTATRLSIAGGVISRTRAPATTQCDAIDSGWKHSATFAART